jgi:hypothetical protein
VPDIAGDDLQSCGSTSLELSEALERLKESAAHERVIDTNVLTPHEVRLLLEAAQPARSDGDGALITTH